MLENSHFSSQAQISQPSTHSTCSGQGSPQPRQRGKLHWSTAPPQPTSSQFPSWGLALVNFCRNHFFGGVSFCAHGFNESTIFEYTYHKLNTNLFVGNLWRFVSLIHFRYQKTILNGLIVSLFHWRADGIGELALVLLHAPNGNIQPPAGCASSESWVV